MSITKWASCCLHRKGQYSLRVCLIFSRLLGETFCAGREATKNWRHLYGLDHNMCIHEHMGILQPLPWKTNVLFLTGLFRLNHKERTKINNPTTHQCSNQHKGSQLLCLEAKEWILYKDSLGFLHLPGPTLGTSHIVWLRQTVSGSDWAGRNPKENNYWKIFLLDSVENWIYRAVIKWLQCHLVFKGKVFTISDYLEHLEKSKGD